MTTNTAPPVLEKRDEPPVPPPPLSSGEVAENAAKRLSRPWATAAALIIAVLWTRS
jgi:hypothetical protein